MIEEMTIDDLLSWANGLGVCTFKKRECKWQHQSANLWEWEIVCEKGQVKITMHLGRFSESVPDVGGKRCVHFDYWDERAQCGGGCAYADLDKLAARIEKRAVDLGLAEAQMSIFSLL